MTRRSDQIRRYRSGAVDVQILPWDIDSVVSLQGSWSVPVSYTERAGLELDILTAMLDKGTRHRDKLTLSAQLERVGASIGFSSGSGKVHVAARCLAPDLPLVLELIREQVEWPALPSKELTLLKGRLKAQLKRQRSDPGSVCRKALSRSLFGPDHPYRELDFDEADRLLDALDLDELAHIHGSPASWEGLRLAVVGDVSHLDPRNLAEALVLKEGGEEAFRMPGSRFLNENRQGRHHVSIPDRVNLNVQLGQAVDLTVDDAAYLPLWVGIFILGGNFSSRLMSTVRDEKGLTYGIRSSLGEASRAFGGAWTTSVTLSQDRLEEGIAATREVIDRFTAEGVTREELAERIETLTGSYEVELATTSGVAGRILRNISRGREPGYLDDHPETLRGITVESVNGSIQRYLDATRLMLVTAGTALDS